MPLLLTKFISAPFFNNSETKNSKLFLTAIINADRPILLTKFISAPFFNNSETRDSSPISTALIKRELPLLSTLFISSSESSEELCASLTLQATEDLCLLCFFCWLFIKIFLITIFSSNLASSIAVKPEAETIFRSAPFNNNILTIFSS